MSSEISWIMEYLLLGFLGARGDGFEAANVNTSQVVFERAMPAWIYCSAGQKDLRFQYPF